MVITVYISGISGNKEVKKRQQRVLMILDSRNIKYEVIDIAEPGRETDRELVKKHATQPGLPPQLFNGDNYCGDYDQFDLSNEIDELDKFLKMELPLDVTPVIGNGISNSHESTPDVNTTLIENEQTHVEIVKDDITEESENKTISSSTVNNEENEAVVEEE